MSCPLDTTQCPQPGLKPRLLALDSNALTMTLPTQRLTYFMIFFPKNIWLEFFQGGIKGATSQYFELFLPSTKLHVPLN